MGGIGGVLFERTLVPWLASSIPSLSVERTTIVNPKEEIIINEAQALEVATRTVYPTLVLLERQNAAGEVLDQASGAVVTSDGVIVTTSDVLSVSGAYMVHRERETRVATFIAEDSELGLALFRANVSGWPVVNWAEARDLALGKRLFLLAGEKDPTHEPLIAELQEGAITKVEGEQGPEVSSELLQNHPGAPVFTIEGRLLGLAGEERLIFAEGIRAFFEDTDISETDE